MIQKCLRNVKNAPKGIGQALDTFEEVLVI